MLESEAPKSVEDKQRSEFTQKIIKVIIVIAYLIGVSGAGFLMSLYYIFFWDPQIRVEKPEGFDKN